LPFSHCSPLSACLYLLVPFCMSLSNIITTTHTDTDTHMRTHTQEIHTDKHNTSTQLETYTPRIISTFKTQLLESVCLSVSLCVSLCLSFLSFSFYLLLSNKITNIHSDTHRVFVPLNHHFIHSHIHFIHEHPCPQGLCSNKSSHYTILYTHIHTDKVFVLINHQSIHSHIHFIHEHPCPQSQK
jgi:hypothetical protein